MQQWTGRDPNQYNRLEYWRKRLGHIKLIDLTPQLLRQHLKDYQAGKCLRGDGRNRSKNQLSLALPKIQHKLDKQIEVVSFI